MSDIRTFETLDVWKSARDFRNKIYEWAHQLPDQETYRLKDQIICASRAIGANIAEGYGRFHYQENIQFCRQARDSLYETLDHLYVGLDQKYLGEMEFEKFKEQIFNINGLLNGYISHIQKQRDASNE